MHYSNEEAKVFHDKRWHSPPHCLMDALHFLCLQYNNSQWQNVYRWFSSDTTFTFAVRPWDNRQGAQYNKHKKQDIDQNFHRAPQKSLYLVLTEIMCSEKETDFSIWLPSVSLTVNNRQRSNTLFGLPHIRLVRLLFSSETVFFSHNNSARTVFFS